MSEIDSVTIPKYHYDQLLKVLYMASERVELKDLLYEKEKKLADAVFQMKRPELEEKEKSK